MSVPVLRMSFSLQEGSFFALKHPHDLVAFMHQGIEGDRVEVMRRNLLKRKKLVDTSRTLYSDNKLLTEESFVSKKPHCQGAGKSLSVIDLQTSTVLLLENKGIRTIDHIGTRRLSSRDVRRPNCSSVPFTYSIHSYDHLEGVSNRWQLSQIPEEGLSGVIPTGSDSPTNFGHRVAKALDKVTLLAFIHLFVRFYLVSVSVSFCVYWLCQSVQRVCVDQLN